MEFVNKELGCKFSLPEPFRMRHLEQYEAARDTARAVGAQFAPSINWVGALGILEGWECELLPDPEGLTPDTLAEVHGKVLQIVIWVASKVVIYITKVMFIPKN